MIKTGFFVFLWIWPEPVRGSQREENFQKTSLKAKKNSLRFGRHHFNFFKLLSSSPWPFCCFYVMYASFRSVTDKNSKMLTPTRTRNFLLTSMDREFYATRGKGTSAQRNVKKSQTVLDPFTLWIQVSRYLNSHSLSVELGFKHFNRSRNSGIHKQKFSLFRNQDHLT